MFVYGSRTPVGYVAVLSGLMEHSYPITGSLRGRDIQGSGATVLVSFMLMLQRGGW